MVMSKYKKYSRAPLSRTQAKAVRKIAVKAVASVAEKKHSDNQATTTAIPSDTPYVVKLHTVTAGDAANQRIGDVLTMKSINFKSMVLRDTTTGDDAAFRLLLVQWLESDATAPTAGDILEDASRFDAMVSPYKLDVLKNYRVLYDTHGNVGDNSGPDYQFRRKKLVKFLKKDLHYDASNNCDGSIYLIALSDRPAANAPPTLTWYSRMRYIDA